MEGDMDYIDLIATQGRELLQDQFNHGVLQDFPIEVRREKEEEITKKTKKVGHTGGRGGVNGPRGKGKDVADSGGADVSNLEDDYDHVFTECDPLVHVGTDPAHVIPEDVEPPRVIPEDVERDIIPSWNMGFTPGGSLLPTQDFVEAAHHQPQPEKEPAGDHMNLRPRKRKVQLETYKRRKD